MPTPHANPREDALSLPARPGPDPRTHGGDVPLLDAALLPPPPTDRRFSRLVRRIDFPALEQHVGALDAEFVRLHDPVVQRFQELLDQLAGEACPRAEDNHKLVALVNRRVDGLGIQLMHAKEEGALVRGRLKYSPGMFEFWTPGKHKSQLYSGVAFPKLVATRALSSDVPG